MDKGSKYLPGDPAWSESEDLATEKGMREFQERNFPKKCPISLINCSKLCRLYSDEFGNCKIDILLDMIIKK